MSSKLYFIRLKANACEKKLVEMKLNIIKQHKGGEGVNFITRTIIT